MAYFKGVCGGSGGEGSLAGWFRLVGRVRVGAARGVAGRARVPDYDSGCCCACDGEICAGIEFLLHRSEMGKEEKWTS